MLEMWRVSVINSQMKDLLKVNPIDSTIDFWQGPRLFYFPWCPHQFWDQPSLLSNKYWLFLSQRWRLVSRAFIVNLELKLWMHRANLVSPLEQRDNFTFYLFIVQCTCVMHIMSTHTQNATFKVLVIFWWSSTSDNDGSTCEIYGLDIEILNNSYKIGEEMSFLFHSLAKVLELFQCCLPWKPILVTLIMLLFENCNILCNIDWHIM